MGLSTSMYTGISGLNAHGEKMSSIGNNLANVNTIGFKKSRMDFEDAMYSPVATSSGPGQTASIAGTPDQVGRGVMVSAVMGDFSQGSMKSTSEVTDLAVTGEGFFIVSPQASDSRFYTRAGNFRFDNRGTLVDPHGYALQGREVAAEDRSPSAGGTSSANGIRTVGDMTDIRIETLQAPPSATGAVDVMTNLDSSSSSRCTSAGGTNPCFAMFESWNADADPDRPLGQNLYSYQSTIKVYDENGNGHDLTVYYDKVDQTEFGANWPPNDPGNDYDSGDQFWEYLVTVPPSEDNRADFSGAGVQNKGILMAGTMTFTSSGELRNTSAFTHNGGGANPDLLTSWSTQNNFENGHPVATANFTGASQPQDIAINFGGNSESSTWSANVTVDSVGTDPDSVPFMDSVEVEELSSTNYSSGSTTINQAQDGYTSGYLQDISVSQDGVVSGRYSNGEVLNLYQLNLADFPSKQGLSRAGGTLFTETRASGSAATGAPGTGGLGAVSSNSLEQSNVDISEEFVKMIVTQKGFQANSRTITTTDQMLQEVVNLKR